VGSCTHHFCFACLIKWCLHDGKRCPLCKTFINEIRFDKDYDLLISKINKDISFEVIDDKIQCNRCKHIIIEYPNGYIGLTLENKNGPGIIIQGINERGLGYKKGLRKKDNILFLNNIPCVSHSQTIEIINNCQQVNKRMDFLILKNK